jgi:endogenous inhibitor of DNA gyrase (YacG/DUF329 family)
MISNQRGSDPANCPACGRSDASDQRAENPLQGEPLPPAARPFAPFCSNRCRLLDLSDWLTESYRIADPLDSLDPDLDDL